MKSTPSGSIYKSPTAQIVHTKEWRLMEVESLNWSYFFSLFHFCPSYFYYYGPLPLSSLKEILVTRPMSFPGSWSFDPNPNPNSDRVPVTTTRTNKSRDNKIELGAKSPEGFNSRRTGLLEPGFDSHSESPSQEKP